MHRRRQDQAEEINWIKGRFTGRFAGQVYRLTSITTNQGEAGWCRGLDDETVYRMDRRILEGPALEKLDPPAYMSVDEVAWQKWHRYFTNAVDIEKKKVIWNHNGRGKETLDRFYHALGPDHCERIEAAASDGAKGHPFPQPGSTPPMPYHFHVNKCLNDALDAARKEELKKARQENDGELSRILHCNKRFILMQNTVTHKKREILDRLSRLNERVCQAMLLKEQFLSIYGAGDWEIARTNLKEWMIAAIKSKIPAFADPGY